MLMELQTKPYIVYYLPYEDNRFFQRSKKPEDYVCCVMAENQTEALRKTEIIAQNNGAKYVKFLGVATGREEWVNETTPLRDPGTGPYGGINTMNNKYGN